MRLPTGISKTTLPALAFCVMSFGTHAQNHIPNPSFEVQTECPDYFFSNLVAEPWQNANDGSTDHFHTCAPPQWCGVPDNFFGWQQPKTGNAYGGGWSRGYPNADYREFLTTPLTTPLIAGKMYYLSFYISLAEQSCGIVPYGAFLTQSIPPFIPDEYLIDATPQYEHTGGFLDDKENWIHMEGCILAQGGEAWIIFGNFHNALDSPLDPACFDPPIYANAYYYLDDVGLYPTEPEEEFEADLGGPFVDCFEVTVDPEDPGVYYWSDGTIGPTFTTNESGIYSFSVVDSCRLGTGTFEVVVLGDPVELGGLDTQACAGEIFTITLNEDYGEYTWSDGTVGPTIEISQPGEYSVTLDDGCAVSSDEIDVEFVDPVPEDPLGDDTHVCNGETWELQFDDVVGDFMWQDGSMDNFYNIINAGTYSVTITNACGQETDAITVVEIVEPEVELGPDTVLCQNSILEIQLDPHQGDYVWQDGSPDPFYTITEPGTYTVFVYNACGS